MAVKYCILCQRHVEPKRQIGVGTLIMVLATGGFWLLCILFYSPKCPICKSSRWGRPKPSPAPKSITT